MNEIELRQNGRELVGRHPAGRYEPLPEDVLSFFRSKLSTVAWQTA